MSNGYYETIPGSIGEKLSASQIDEILYGKNNPHAKCAREIFQLEEKLIPDIIKILESYFPAKY